MSRFQLLHGKLLLVRLNQPHSAKKETFFQDIGKHLSNMLSELNLIQLLTHFLT